MIPQIFARSVERDIFGLAVYADYLEDHGKDGAILRLIADNYFLLDDSGHDDHYGHGEYDGDDWGDGNCYGIGNGSGTGGGYNYYGMRYCEGDGYGHGIHYGIYSISRFLPQYFSDGNGSGSGHGLNVAGRPLEWGAISMYVF